ncbi:class I SAM-dependent methyltransferase [Pseudomaricurvus sp.]|uniref:class I SAM-dependent methyltransferase n=1 Tax=Pseudomaricurvus sp. TaxID=2004510 RepID=UPI003F6ABD6C
MESTKASLPDPVSPSWSEMTLPKAWLDELDMFSREGLNRFWRRIFSKKKQPVTLPKGLCGADCIPKYALQDFHNLPNGVYSQRLSRGYITGFDVSMLGHVERGRQWIAQALSDGDSFLDLGCGGGKTAAAIASVGASDVWGLDPSPYLLKHAAADHPGIRFVQGVVEDLPFSDQRFDGVAACFLFHEVPPRYIQQALQEIARVLKPGGRLVIMEPSAEQYYAGWRDIIRRYRFSGLYFKWLAGFVYEPFVRSWHEFDLQQGLSQVGLELAEDTMGMPVRSIVAVKPG